MSAATPIPLSSKSQEAFIAYYQSLQDNYNTNRSEQRARFEESDRQYQREKDRHEEQLKAQAANKAGDATRFQNMTVPVVMPQVESAVTYQASVFLTGDPIFGVVAAPQFMDEALQIETLLENDSLRGGWTRELLLFFRDGFKYNFAPIEVSWEREVTVEVVTDITVSTKEGIPKETLWAGNKVTRLDPYNTFVDNRVAPSQVYKDGEYAGYTEFMSRIRLKSFIAALPDKIIANIKPAFESGTGTVSTGADSSSRAHYVPSINPKVTEQDTIYGGTNWMKWAGLNDKANKIDYKDGYEVTTLYCRILPSEFNLRVPNSNTPQIYKLVIVNHQHIIYAERQTNAHNYLPILIGQPLEDGLDYQTKSLSENGTPFQELATAYMSSIIASRRRAINDRVLYDPSRITSAHINSANPSAKIPVRPAAYGKNIADAVYAFPYRNDQDTGAMQQIQTIIALSNQLAGQNQASQGQFVKGNKTLQEFESVMANANGRDQLASILLEHQTFMPMKHILKLNILQFQGGTTVFNRDKDKMVEIDPVKLRRAVTEFRVSDGLIPSSKIMNADTFSVALQVLGSSPQLGAAYNLGPMFSYMMKTQGAKINEFEKSQEQVAYEQALQTWQAMTQLALEKGTSFDQPQPLPEQFGYNPGNNTTGAPAANTPNAPATPNPTEG